MLRDLDLGSVIIDCGDNTITREDASEVASSKTVENKSDRDPRSIVTDQFKKIPIC